MNWRIFALILLLAAGCPAEAPRYIIVFHNLNSFLDPADQDLAIEAYRGFDEVGRRNGVTVQPFFTGLSFGMYLRRAPQLMEELKNSGRDWHHHGANRPPNPQLIARVGNKPWPEALRVVEEYESSALDPRTGKLDPARPGGLKEMVAWFGRPPFSTGRFVRAPILAATKLQYGVRMGIGTHDWFGIPSSWLWYMGTLNRPDDAFVHPNFDFMDWVRVEWAKKQGQDPRSVKRIGPADQPSDIYTRIEQRLAQLDPDTSAFLTFGFHNNDFFGYNTETKKRYEPEYRKFFLEKADEFLRWITKTKGFRPVTLRQAYDMAAANVVTPAAGDARVFAGQIAESVEKEHSLPLYVRSKRSGHSLVEAWQVLAASLADRPPEVRDLFGPTALEPKSAAPIRAGVKEIRAAAKSLKMAGAIPAAVEVGGQRANAAEFLYLMAKAVEGSQTVEAQPLAMLPPVAPREQRFDDPLSLLQMWTLKPAYFARAGGRLQRATSVEVNLRGGRMQRDNEMRLLRPEDRPPW